MESSVQFAPIDQSAVQAKAYEIWEAWGCPEGVADKTWQEAERVLRLEQAAQAKQQQSKPAKSDAPAKVNVTDVSAPSEPAPARSTQADAPSEPPAPLPSGVGKVTTAKEAASSPDATAHPKKSSSSRRARR